MEASFSEELTMMVETARKVVRDEIMSRNSICLRPQRRFPTRNLQSCGSRAWCSWSPESIGGAGLSCFEHCAIGEEIAYGCLGVNTRFRAIVLRQCRS